MLDGTAYATLVQAATTKVDGPITAESEAEKPTRAVRKKVTDTKNEVPALAIEEAAPVEDAVAEVEEPPTDEPPSDGPEAEAATDGEVKPKKKTRRGSRGGRNRRKKPAAAAAAENGEPPAEQVPKLEPKPEPEPAAKPERARAATIHVPSADLGTDDNGAPAAEGDQPPKKKRTRRGSRGGRNRRRKPAAATGDAKPEPSG